MTGPIPSVLVGAALVLAALVLLGPSQLGGAMTYVTVTGRSMEPAIVAGDLVVVRRSGTYAVGDVVAYRSQVASVVVIHRIVAVDGQGRFVLQGDRNSFVDRQRPSADEVLGVQVLRLPTVGALIDGRLRPTITVAAPALVLWGLWPWLMGRPRRRHNGERRRAARP